MSQSLTQQIADIKERIEAAKGTPAEATFQEILKDLEQQLQEGQKGTPTETATEKTTKIKSKPASDETEVTSGAESEGEASSETTSETTDKKKDKSKSKNFFQAVGQLRGVIRRKEDETGWYLEQGQTQYDLALSKKLQYVIHFVEGQELTLTVYPQVRYEKGDRESCKIYFKLVGWTEERSPNEGLFLLKGIWQFIPQYKRPVISVYRNQKQWEGDRCKASHIPVLWKDSTVKPFKFNPKVKTQSDKYFAQLKTKFIPRLNTFGVVEEMDEATLKVPKYIKPVKKDLTEVTKSTETTKPTEFKKIKEITKPQASE
jgi:hypothetical protein